MTVLEDVTMRFKRYAVATALGLLAVNGVALADEDSRDPYEKFNRAMFTVNEQIDTYVAKPLAKGYDQAVPLPAKASIGSALGNVGDLWIGVNNAMQGKFSEAGNDLGRLVINSTLGILGLFDVASELGLEKHDEDFGQTLAVWGIKDSDYLVLPVFGPRTVRDAAGLVADSYVDPIGDVRPISARNSIRGVRFVDLRASLLPTDKVVEEAALDKYAYIRDAYLQRRRHQIYDGRPPKIDDDY